MARLVERVRIGIVGLGWVGQEVARAALEDSRVALVGVADMDPAKAGRDLGEIMGEGRVGLAISSSVEELLSRARPEVAVVCTSSDVRVLRPTLEQCIEYGAHVVTTCENLADLAFDSGQLAQALNERAQKKGVVILPTGVNPGFAMDRLPVLLTHATRNVRRVRVLRVVDAASRRAQLQMKVGVGMTPQEFGTAMSAGSVGHHGLGASLRLIARGLGVSLDKTSEALRPLIAEYPTRSSVLGPVEAGRVRGIYQVARGYQNRHELITLELTVALDEPNPRDAVDIVGEPPLRLEGEFPGDTCTVATVLSAVHVVVNLPAGLRTVLDLPLEQPAGPDSARDDAVLVTALQTATAIPGSKRVRNGDDFQGVTQPSLEMPPRRPATNESVTDPKIMPLAAEARTQRPEPRSDTRTPTLPGIQNPPEPNEGEERPTSRPRESRGKPAERSSSGKEAKSEAKPVKNGKPKQGKVKSAKAKGNKPRNPR